MARASEVCMPPRREPFPSTWQMFENGANIDPNALAITVCHQSSDHLSNLLPGSHQTSSAECLQWTYRELRHASLVISKALADAGVKRGSTVIAPLANGIETHLIRIVSFILQLTVVALDAELVEPGRREELAFYIKSTLPELAVVSDARGANGLDEGAEQASHSFDFRILTRQSNTPDLLSWTSLDASKYDDETLEDFAKQQQPELDKDGKRTGWILFTSGTSTGVPKGCPNTVENIVSAALNQVCVAEPGHTYALHSPHSRAIYSGWSCSALAHGDHVVQTHSHFDPDKTYQAVAKYKIDMLLFVPAQVKVLAAQKHLDWTKLTSVRRLLIGGDLVTSDVVEIAHRLFPSARTTTAWGMTEGGGAIGMQGTDITLPPHMYHSVVTLGKTGRWSKIRIVDPHGKVLPRGAEGELIINSPGMVDRYVGDVQPEAFYTDELGRWLRTGDKAVMDEDEFIFIIGRIKDIIKQSGVNISPAVLEATINKVDGFNVSVVGVPDEIRGEVPVAVNSGKIEEANKAKMKELVVDSLGKDYALKEVYDLSELGMGGFPLSAQGKVQKFKLRDAILDLEQRKSTG